MAAVTGFQPSLPRSSIIVSVFTNKYLFVTFGFVGAVSNATGQISFTWSFVR